MTGSASSLLEAASGGQGPGVGLKASEAPGMQMWLCGCTWPGRRCGITCPVCHGICTASNTGACPSSHRVLVLSDSGDFSALPAPRVCCSLLQLSQPGSGRAWAVSGGHVHHFLRAALVSWTPSSFYSVSLSPSNLNATVGVDLVFCGGWTMVYGGSGCPRAPHPGKGQLGLWPGGACLLVCTKAGSLSV